MLLEWQTIAEWIGLAAGAAVGLKVLWSLLKKLWSKMGSMFGINDLKKDLGCLAKQLDFVASELLPNGGSSVRDALNRIEHSVALTNERQRARMLDSVDMVFETDSEGNCIWVNRTYARITNRLPAELLGHGWVNAIAAEDRNHVTEGWYTSTRENREFDMEFSFATPEGVKIPARVRSYKMKDTHDETLGYLGTVTLL